MSISQDKYDAVCYLFHGCVWDPQLEKHGSYMNNWFQKVMKAAGIPVKCLETLTIQSFSDHKHLEIISVHATTAK